MSKLVFIIEPEGFHDRRHAERMRNPEYRKAYEQYHAQLAREAEFNRKHPRCIGCGRFVKKHRNQCSDCEDYAY